MKKFNLKNLLSREAFKEQVFRRDLYKCVVCGAKAVDAHHILERKLFEDGGYYLNNGASLCESCHIKAETTEISVENIRNLCGIKESVVPNSLDPNKIYDKWGNEILENGSRIRGSLFEDKGTQRALKNDLWRFKIIE